MIERELVQAIPKPQAGAIKYDQGKLRWGLLPLDAVEEVVKVITFGASKYGDRNWEKGFDFNRNIDALHRHLAAWQRGQDTDAESSLNHLAHAMCNLLFLLTFQLRGVGNDDRSKY